MDRDFVWEFDYGERKPLIPAIKELLIKQNARSLQMVDVLINHNVYNLELFIVVSYNKPNCFDISDMKKLFSSVGGKYRPDITYDELTTELIGRRFNKFTMSDESSVDIIFSKAFGFAERAEVEKEFSMRPLGKKIPVFISHSSYNKSQIENLIPYLNAANLPVWYDKVNIDYGDSIVQKVQEGIQDSSAVIFWITNEFLDSNWCKIEMDSFLSRLASRNDVVVITIVHEGVDINRLPIFISNRKYLYLTKDKAEDFVAKEIIPILKKKFAE